MRWLDQPDAPQRISELLPRHRDRAGRAIITPYVVLHQGYGQRCWMRKRERFAYDEVDSLANVDMNTVVRKSRKPARLPGDARWGAVAGHDHLRLSDAAAQQLRNRRPRQRVRRNGRARSDGQLHHTVANAQTGSHLQAQEALICKRRRRRPPARPAFTPSRQRLPSYGSDSRAIFLTTLPNCLGSGPVLYGMP